MFILLALFVAILDTAHADGMKAGEIIEKLLCQSSQACNNEVQPVPGTAESRGLTPILDPEQQQQMVSEQAQSGMLPSIDLDIYFPFNSTRITRSALSDLTQLGLALSDRRLSDAHIAIIGHTDHKGSANYNLRLSELRAHAVRDFIVKRFLADPTKLQAYGVGSSEPKVVSNLFSALNRRVQIVNIGRATMTIDQLTK